MIKQSDFSRTGLIAGLVLLFAITSVMAAIQVEVDGSPLSLDVPPALVNGRTMVQLRGIFEALGAQVNWDSYTRTITATKGDTNVQLGIGKPRALINGKVAILDAPAMIRNGSTMVPLRFVSEALGADVKWIEATQMVTITTANKTTQVPKPMTTEMGDMHGMMQRKDMQSMMHSMMQMPTSQFDQSFLQNMIHHHSGAIDMSHIVVQNATHLELRQFAQKVIDTQSQQNQEMSIWLKNLFKSSASMAPMPIDEQTTKQLRSLSGRDLEIQYMQAMIVHHQEAVEMGRMAEQKAERLEIKELATSIVTEQSTEISQLNQWLSDWYNWKQ